MTEADIDRRLLNFIREHVEQHGYPPSVREVAEDIDRSLAATARRMRRLHAEGMLRVTPGVSRGVAVRPEGMKLLGVETFRGGS